MKFRIGAYVFFLVLSMAAVWHNHRTLLINQKAIVSNTSKKEDFGTTLRNQCDEQPELPAMMRLQRDELIRQLHPARLIDLPNVYELACGPWIEPWSSAPNSYIAVLETTLFVNLVQSRSEGAKSYAFGTLSIALVQVHAKDKRISILAKTKTPDRFHSVELRLGTTTSPHQITKLFGFEQFDSSSYRLNERETAFGIRTSQDWFYTGGAGTDEWLHLYRIQGGEIVPILSTPIASYAGWSAYHEEQGDPEGALVVEIPRKSQGMFDLRKYLRGRHKSMTFHWNGSEYETHDPEIIEWVNG